MVSEPGPSDEEQERGSDAVFRLSQCVVFSPRHPISRTRVVTAAHLTVSRSPIGKFHWPQKRARARC